MKPDTIALIDARGCSPDLPLPPDRETAHRSDKPITPAATTEPTMNTTTKATTKQGVRLIGFRLPSPSSSDPTQIRPPDSRGAAEWALSWTAAFEFFRGEGGQIGGEEEVRRMSDEQKGQ